MTKINFTKNKNNLEYDLSVVGHAEYAEAGKDIVCAGVSTLVYALAQTLMDMKGVDEKASLEDGNAEISVKIRHYDKEIEVDTAFNMAMNGFRMIAAQYEDNISIVE